MIIAKHINDLKFTYHAQCGILEKIVVTRSEKFYYSGSYDVEIFLKSEGNEKNVSIKSKFYGSLEIKILDVSPCIGCFLDVIDIKDRGMEGINYKVVDTENNFFSFYCREFEVFYQPL